MSEPYVDMPTNEPYVVGKFYRVPCVRGYWSIWDDNWPVFGAKHEDFELLGFKPHHYHLDARFLSDRQWRRVVGRFGDFYALFSRPLQDVDDSIGTGQTLTPPTTRRLKCRRQWPEHPMARGTPAFASRIWSKLRSAYADATLLHGRICPHRGAPLSTIPVDSEGCVTCPVHGLRWNVSSGKQVIP